MYPNRIMAVDPGGTTGIALFNRKHKQWEVDQIPFDPIHLYNIFLRTCIFTVICETFDYRPVGKYDFGGSRAIPKVDLTPREVIGILKLACAQAGTEIIWQKPACINGDDGKKSKDPDVFWTDAKVKQLDLYKPNKVHAMDAVKHILYYRAFTLAEDQLFHALRPTKITGFEEEMI